MLREEWDRECGYQVSETLSLALRIGLKGLQGLRQHYGGDISPIFQCFRFLGSSDVLVEKTLFSVSRCLIEHLIL
jgi:hypothetical protein